jgi:NTP pyrophosphatase (non-canonical NTP hydrolase)
MMKIDLIEYQKFVDAVTSKTSKDLTTFMNRLDELDGNYIGNGQHGPDINVSLLLTAGLGLGSESGEFQEIVKKMFFQGKPLNEDNVFHMKRELGDILFYWIIACLALNFDPNQVIQENIDKLSKRYPNGFTVEKSENRAENDI